MEVVGLKLGCWVHGQEELVLVEKVADLKVVEVMACDEADLAAVEIVDGQAVLFLLGFVLRFGGHFALSVFVDHEGGMAE